MSKEASLATASPNRGNNFDSLRILAALGVLVSHAFPLSGAGDREPILQISLRQTTAGTLAVSVFFVISGYLITKSYDRSHSARAFVIGRVLRLVPALAVVELLLSFCAGPLLTRLSTADYLSQMSLYTNILVNLSCLGFRDGLPGVFLHNPFPHAVDGSLWTLEYEVACYGMVLVVGYLGLLNRYVMGAGYMTALIALRYWVGGYYVSFGTDFWLAQRSICGARRSAVMSRPCAVAYGQYRCSGQGYASRWQRQALMESSIWPKARRFVSRGWQGSGTFLTVFISGPSLCNNGSRTFSVPVSPGTGMPHYHFRSYLLSLPFHGR